jgi:ribonuclease-3
MMTDLQSLQDKISYHFQNAELLKQALTHSSKNGDLNNERLEFLGDRVLNLVMAQALYERFPKEAEGAMAKRHSALVQGRMLAVVGTTLGLGDYLILSESERHSGGAENENILSDGMEALLGAVFLDGGLEPARQIILTLWGDNIDNLTEAHQDPKTELQEWVQARGLPLPEYEIVDKTGPDHAPLFVIEIRVQGYEPIRAEGPSRRQGEKTAAGRMLRKVLGNE